jgi:hypothetical protein
MIRNEVAHFKANEAACRTSSSSSSSTYSLSTLQNSGLGGSETSPPSFSPPTAKIIQEHSQKMDYMIRLIEEECRCDSSYSAPAVPSPSGSSSQIWMSCRYPELPDFSNAISRHNQQHNNNTIEVESISFDISAITSPFYESYEDSQTEVGITKCMLTLPFDLGKLNPQASGRSYLQDSGTSSQPTRCVSLLSGSFPSPDAIIIHTAPLEQ